MTSPRDPGLPLHEPFSHTWNRAWLSLTGPDEFGRPGYSLPLAVVLGWRDARKLRRAV
jgi:hypothetical protein